MPEAISVFIVAESEAQLVGRLVARKTEPLDKMVTRVKTARCARDTRRARRGVPTVLPLLRGCTGLPAVCTTRAGKSCCWRCRCRLRCCCRPAAPNRRAHAPPFHCGPPARRQETRQMADFDYVVVNREGRLDECVAQLGAIIDAEKLRSQPRR